MNRKLHILHLEDSGNDAELVKETLTAGGIACDIVVVDNRDDFNAALEREQFDLILADYNLPAFDGVSALANASAKGCMTPFLFVSGTMGEEIAVESLKHGATDYIVKSNLARLVPSVKRALQEKEERLARESADEHVRKQKAELEVQNSLLRAAQIEIEESRNKFADLYSFAPVTYLTLDENGSILEMNTRGAEIFGKDLSELIGRSLQDLVDDLSRDTVAAHLEAVFSSLVKKACVVRIAGMAGEDSYALMESLAAREGTGTRICRTALTDISERILSEQRAVRSIREWQTTFDAISDPISLLDGDGVIIQCNRALTMYLKKSAGQIMGRPCWSVIHGAKGPPDAYPLMRARETLQRESMEFPIGGRWFDITVDPVIDSSGTAAGFVHVMSDITERKKLEGQLLHAQKMEAIGTLAGGIAHDFNNILNVIIGYGSMVLDGLGADHPSRERMREVLSAADRAANLTRRLLQFSRKDSVEFKHVQVNEIVAGMEKMLSRIIGEDVELRIRLADNEAIVFADAGQMEQVLMNLVTNARDAMPRGGRLTISTGSMEIDDDYLSVHGYGTPGHYASIFVADTGTGMSAETQSRIFDPFFTTKGVGEGTGLGLSIVYGIIKQHKGFIEATSEIGKGTLFKILLPLSGKPASEQQVDVDAPGPRRGSETILIAEDEAPLRELMRIILESFGYTVLAAEDGEEAVRMFLEHRDRIRLVILDLVMPKKNGKDAADEMKKAQPGVRTLYMSGYSEDTFKKQGVGEEGLVFVQKPVSPKVLLTKIRELLDA